MEAEGIRLEQVEAEVRPGTREGDRGFLLSGRNVSDVYAELSRRHGDGCFKLAERLSLTDGGFRCKLHGNEASYQDREPGR